MVKWLHRYLKKVIDDSTTSEDTVKLLRVSDKSVVESGKNNQFSNCVRRQENATPNLGYFVALGSDHGLLLCISSSISLDIRTLNPLLPSKFFSVHLKFAISSGINFSFGDVFEFALAIKRYFNLECTLYISYKV